MIKIVSTIYDGRIGACNILLEISIKEYIEVAKNILKKNEFQRKKVKRTATVYSLLRSDLKRGCTIPPIVLAVGGDIIKDLQIAEETSFNEDQINEWFTANNLIILDGLQRTYNLIEAVEEFKIEDPADFNKFTTKPLRIELYIGINRLGILYRMLTLNTGQTPMSTRHQIEILYSDYYGQAKNGITLFRQIDEKSIKEIGQYQFDDVIEGFNAYIERDETGIDRIDILDNIKNLEKLAEENNDQDIFDDFITVYNQLVEYLDSISGGWVFEGDMPHPYGKSILTIFSKPQTLAAFGAAIGEIKENPYITGFDSISDFRHIITKIQLGGTAEDTWEKLLKRMDEVRNKAKKIGIEQRAFLKSFFRVLLQNDMDSFLNINKSIEHGFNRYKSQRW